MPSIFATADRQQLFARIATLRAETARQWGKMDVGQMLAHCQAPLRVALGELQLRRNLIGILFGKLAKKKLLAPAPWKQGMPTAPQFKVTDTRDFASERGQLVALVRRLGEGGPAALSKAPHPFFGPLTVAEWDALQWRHLDHHLRQFGA